MRRLRVTGRRAQRDTSSQFAVPSGAVELHVEARRPNRIRNTTRARLPLCGHAVAPNATAAIVHEEGRPPVSTAGPILRDPTPPGRRHQRTRPRRARTALRSPQASPRTSQGRSPLRAPASAATNRPLRRPPGSRTASSGDEQLALQRRAGRCRVPGHPLACFVRPASRRTILSAALATSARSWVETSNAAPRARVHSISPRSAARARVDPGP